MIEINRFISNNYLRAFVFLLLLITTGIYLNSLTGIYHYSFPKFPYNLYILAIFILSLIIFYYRFKKNKLIIWFSETAVFIMAFLVLSIYIIFQILLKENIIQINISFIKDPTILFAGWVYDFLRLFLFISISFSILKFLLPVKVKYFGLIFYRFGIGIILIAFWFGVPDRQKLSLKLLENKEKSNIGISTTDKVIEIPFYIQLIDFDITISNYSILSISHWKSLYYNKIKKLPDMSSRLVISYDSIRNDTILLTLYKPITIKGWRLTQKGFDESKGKFSTLSIIEIRKNPWRKIAQIGYYSIILGFIFLIMFYKKTKTKHTRFLPAHNN